MKKLSKIYTPTFTIDYIPDEVFERMKGKSYPEDATILLDDLRYLQVSYYNFNNESVLGEIVCNKSIAEDLIDIFKKLYKAKYQIHSINLVDDFDASDDKSMEADNTSCFNFRYIRGTDRLSPHADGVGIDINPVENPCIRDGVVHPEIGSKYVNRSLDFDHKIDEDDLCYKLFTEHGFTWGGSWDNPKDYHHFEKRDNITESLWGNIRDRVNDDSVRKEDDIPNSNFREIEFVDCGCSVLWADRNLIINGDDTFEKDEINFPWGYRYPTENEFEELTGNWSGHMEKNKDGKAHIKNLVFECGNYFLLDNNRRIEINVSINPVNIISTSAGDSWVKGEKKYHIRLIKEK